MPRVCIYQRYLPPDASGAGKQALTLAHQVRDAGWDVILLTDGAEHGDAPAVLEGIPVVRVASLPADPSRAQILKYWFRIGRALMKLRHDFDVLHIHTAHFDQVGAIPVARLLGKPVLVRSSLAGEFATLDSWRGGRFQKRLYRSAQAFVVLSNRLVQEYREADLPPDALRRIPNGVDTERFHPVAPGKKAELRRQLGLPAAGRILVYHGVFIERKSIHWLVDMLETRLAELDLTLLLVGGPAREEVETGYAGQLMTQIERSPAAERIIVRDHDPAVQRYLQAADAYVLPSTSEGLPNALLEAMAVGLVPLVSRTSGSEDVVVDGVSGFMFEPRDAASFQRCIDRAFVASSSGEFARISAAALERVHSGFSARAIGRQYVEVYNRLTGSKPKVAQVPEPALSRLPDLRS